MATAMMAMMMPAISNRTSDTNTNIKNSLFFSLSLFHQPEYLHPYLVKILVLLSLPLLPISLLQLRFPLPDFQRRSHHRRLLLLATLSQAAFSFLPTPVGNKPQGYPFRLALSARPNQFSRRSSVITDTKKNPFSIKVGMTQMPELAEVTAIDQAKLAEDAGACAISELHSSVGVTISVRP